MEEKEREREETRILGIGRFLEDRERFETSVHILHLIH